MTTKLSGLAMKPFSTDNPTQDEFFSSNQYLPAICAYNRTLYNITLRIEV